MPAIPLPYIQKRQQQEVARAKVNDEAKAPTVVETPTPSSPTTTTSNIPLAIVSGSTDGHAAGKSEGNTEPTSPITPAKPATPALEEESTQSEVEEPEISAEGETIGKITKSTTSDIH